MAISEKLDSQWIAECTSYQEQTLITSEFPKEIRYKRLNLETLPPGRGKVRWYNFMWLQIETHLNFRIFKSQDKTR